MAPRLPHICSSLGGSELLCMRPGYLQIYDPSGLGNPGAIDCGMSEMPE